MDAAKASAPYVHAKLAQVQTDVKLTGKLTLEALVQASLPELPANDDGMPKLIEHDGGVEKTT